MKNAVERYAEDRRNTERHLERRGILAKLDRVDSLARHANPVGQRLLRHLSVVEPQLANLILNRAAPHLRRPDGSTKSERRT